MTGERAIAMCSRPEHRARFRNCPYVPAHRTARRAFRETEFHFSPAALLPALLNAVKQRHE